MLESLITIIGLLLLFVGIVTAGWYFLGWDSEDIAEIFSNRHWH